jgi:hypothetical protein
MEGDHEPAMFGVFETAAGMLLGRKNYQGFDAVWPPMAGDGRWADRLNPMPKWVASTTLSNPLEWNATPGMLGSRSFDSGVMLLRYRPRE